MKPYKRIRSKFNPNRPFIKQLLCHHDYKSKIDDTGWSRCLYFKCEKCGKFKDINFYSNRRW